MAKPQTAGFVTRAQVSTDGDFTRRTWRHRQLPVAVQHSTCHLAPGECGLPDVWRVLVDGAIASRHRSPAAAYRRAQQEVRRLLVCSPGGPS